MDQVLSETRQIMGEEAENSYLLMMTTVPTWRRSPQPFASPVVTSFLTCLFPASPLSCQKSSQIFIIPAAAIVFLTPNRHLDGWTCISLSLSLITSFF